MRRRAGAFVLVALLPFALVFACTRARAPEQTIPTSALSSASPARTAVASSPAIVAPSSGAPLPEPVASSATTEPAMPSASASASASPPAPSCPAEMALVEGEYCTSVRQTCVEWIEPPSGDLGRCRKFAPSECVGHRVHKLFCVDRDEFTKMTETLPQTTISWTQSKSVCEKSGKRLCDESEWNFACEGPAMLPYPTGYERDSTKCNFDQMKLLDAQHRVRDLRKPSASLAACGSPFGARNMVGNVDEWTHRDVTAGPNRTALKGGWWMAGRDRCRPATVAHSEIYRDLQTGFRCCADVK